MTDDIEPTKVIDLGALNLAPGSYTIKVKSKASGYVDSAFSNSVTFVVSQLITSDSLAFMTSDGKRFIVSNV